MDCLDQEVSLAPLLMGDHKGCLDHQDFQVLLVSQVLQNLEVRDFQDSLDLEGSLVLRVYLGFLVSQVSRETKELLCLVYQV